jgi:hypothetical protein
MRGGRTKHLLGALAEKVELLPFLEAGRPLDKNNFGPRIGFAYSLDDRTVLRGGWGLYFGDMRRSESGTANAATHRFQVEALNDGRPKFCGEPVRRAHSFVRGGVAAHVQRQQRAGVCAA